MYITFHIDAFTAEFPIVGAGTGLFTSGVGQIHNYVEMALKHKQAVMPGTGSGVCLQIPEKVILLTR
jgi:hypothetical protein